MKPFQRAVELLEEGVRRGVFPSGVLAVGIRDQILLCEARGFSSIVGEKVPAAPDTLYDAASLSKVLSATMIALKMLEEGKLCLTDRIKTFFDAPADKADITVRQLMTHTSGLPAYVRLDGCSAGPEQAAETILHMPLAAEPGEKVIYSCMGYILLGRLLERCGGCPLDELAQKYVFDPLDMSTATYHPAGDIACTEENAAGGCWRGVVHDENARFLGGVSGNAGVFCSIYDCIRFASMLACGGVTPHGRYLSPAVLCAARKNYTHGLGQERCLGFQLAGTQDCFMGDFFPKSALGHTGFTGTSAAIDPISGLYVILLTNRVHPTRENTTIIRFRKVLHNCIMSDYSQNKSIYSVCSAAFPLWNENM